MRIGQGYDVHKLVEGRDLILGGVTIPYEKGLLGHSDADVLIHALMDGQVTLEERIADFRKECNQKITVLAERVYECEQVICRNSYDIALLKMAK